MVEQKVREVGTITHYFPKIGVAVLELSDTLSVGDSILIKGMTTDFEETVRSMQIEHANIVKAQAGQSVGLKVSARVRKGDTVYLML
jgi:putative protease